MPNGITLHFNHRDSSRYRHPLTGEWRMVMTSNKP